RLPAGDPPPSPGTTVASFSTNTADMCYIGCVADRYTACQHNLILYETSARTDCGDEHCKTSAAHKHTAIECGCPTVRHRSPPLRRLDYS
ncbi:unnamed protein product, partial [Mycena citricolor]